MGGHILNGLLFGLGWGESPAMNKIWHELSKTYVKGLTNVVEADVLEGIDPKSVLSTTEISNILELIEQKKVKKLVVNIYKMVGNRFKKIDKIDVSKEETWNSIPKVPSNENATSGKPSMISDLLWNERQRMIDKTEKMLYELERLQLVQSERIK